MLFGLLYNFLHPHHQHSPMAI